jgi:hypothetical protein
VGAVAFSLTLEEVDVAHGVGGLLLREVVGIGGASAGEDRSVRLDDHAPVVEADGGAIGPGPQLLADEGRGEGVEGAVNSTTGTGKTFLACALG